MKALSVAQPWASIICSGIKDVENRLWQSAEAPGRILIHATRTKVRNSGSFWAQPDSFHWCLRDAYLFDEPIPDVKGVRGHLFDVDLDEDNLPPAHKVEFLEPKWDGETLVMPACQAVMDMVESGEKVPEELQDLTFEYQHMPGNQSD